MLNVSFSSALSQRRNKNTTIRNEGRTGERSEPSENFDFPALKSRVNRAQNPLIIVKIGKIWWMLKLPQIWDPFPQIHRKIAISTDLWYYVLPQKIASHWAARCSCADGENLSLIHI